MKTIFNKNYSFNARFNDVNVTISKKNDVFLFANEEWASLDEIYDYITKRWMPDFASIIIDDIKNRFEKIIGEFTESVNGREKQIQAVMNENILTYYVLNRKNERCETFNEGAGIFCFMKNTNNDFEFGLKTIHKSHYQTPRLFFNLMRSVSKFDISILNLV